ncbi:MAG: hypothetical protein F7C07_07695 [Desulfurococcales archaeon]|nr:hypothetical protein [Desulfurococcales archaeon]
MGEECCRAEIELCAGELSKHIFEALLAELDQPSPEKGSVSLRLGEGCLRIRIESWSLSGLRALTNSFLLLTYAAYGSLKQGEQ